MASFPDNIFRCTFMDEQFCILTKVSLKFVSKIPIDNYPVPLFEPMLPQFIVAYMWHLGEAS